MVVVDGERTTQPHEPMQWWEFETNDATYLTWQQHDGLWAGLEFIGADRSKRRNDAFLNRFAQEPQWISPTLEAVQDAVRKIILTRRRLLASVTPQPDPNKQWEIPQTALPTPYASGPVIKKKA